MPPPSWRSFIQPSLPACTSPLCIFFFFNDTATTEIYTLSLHDALPISIGDLRDRRAELLGNQRAGQMTERADAGMRSEEHTSELQSLRHLVCRLLLEKKKTHKQIVASNRSSQKDASPAYLIAGLTQLAR